MMDVSEKLFSSDYHAAYNYATSYTGQKIYEILLDKEVFSEQKNTFTLKEAFMKLGARIEFLPSVKWTLDFLTQEGFISNNGSLFQVNQRVCPKEEVKDFQLNIESSLQLIDYVSEHWTKIVSGQIAPQSVFFGSKGIKLWQNYFSSENELYHVHNLWIADYLAQIISPNAKILELGAGFGSATEQVINGIKEKDIPHYHYMASDLSALMLKKVKVDKWMNTLILDFNKDIQTQVNGKKFDCILAVNALHCANDLEFTLRSIRKSLNQGGLLILSECIRDHKHPLLHQEFIFNLLMGYRQKGENGYFIRGFFSLEDWRHALDQAGYRNVETIVNPGMKKLGTIIRAS